MRIPTRRSPLSLTLFAATLAGCATAPATPKEAGDKTPKETAVSDASTAKPPRADRRPHVTKIHGEELHDDWFWLRGREDKDVLAYLNAENAYSKAMTAHTEDLRKRLYDEMLGHIVEDDSGVPYRKGAWWYYSRTVAGKAYSMWCRKAGGVEAPDEGAAEQVMLDANLLAEGKEYTSVGALAVSPDATILAYSVDHSGGEKYTLHFRDLTTGKDLPEAIEGTYYGLAWANDSKTIFYTTVDESMRPHKVHRHTLGTEPKADVVVLHASDDHFFVTLERSRSNAYIFVSLDSAVTTEVSYLSTDEPNGEFRVLVPRKQSVEYSVDHHGDRFLVRTNDGAINFKLMAAPVASADKQDTWTELIPHREDVTLSGVMAFKGHLAIFERNEGLPTIRITPPDPSKAEGGAGGGRVVPFDEPTYDASPGRNAEFDTTKLRYEYTSLVTPNSTFDIDVATGERKLLKEKPVRNYDRTKYESARVWATAKDGTKVPISLIFPMGLKRDGKSPLFLHGYGSYGYSYDAKFNSSSLSFVDRGWTVGIAHIRGGGELGRKWKNDGKFDKKINTFTDFIDCAQHLVKEGWTSPDRLAIQGGSAGGLLMGAVLNMRPDLFAAAVAAVPFVDVINTMLDETIPLTVIEWEEWGNPNELEAYKTIKAYSPYDNIVAQNYPHLLILAGLNDPRVQYWEPAKWTAKLRATRTDSNHLLLKTNMGAGHGGASGRYGRLKEKAFDYAFVLDRVGTTADGGLPTP
jgi:oligopeptidase B